MDPDASAVDRWITGDYGERYRAFPVSTRCPECRSEVVSDRQGHRRPDGDDRPPFEMVCEDCGHEWEEDS